ncbi:ribose-phosphate diphosphokinase [Archaeoglobus veneficus]|uniref:Ribose-phosphate pyrophosphokinase n=1 Tax=Archaeoglobus veneficus (strain DSM 11195 / SNP6) TaxID=693661 RepID=F2KQ13_ARCVS|nr:ribose-phosphate diphosphokinase [Archaeoglobus veneficus]AEA47616.1 ribose-phosphate pyrophosphokinase [Archaeoglobus veneficus SNP6]
MRIIAGTSSPLLAKRIADELNVPLAKTTFKRFPDGELYVKVEDVDNEVIVVQSVTSNDDLVCLMLLFDALESCDITAVVPYMGYSRQDRKFFDGEAISIRAVARLIESYANKVISVNLHSREAASHFRKLEEVDAMELIGEHYRDEDVVMISPDFGSLERVKRAAKAAGCEFDYLEKRRIDAEHVEITPKSLDVEGRRVVIVDDIISTGGTIVEAAKALRAEKVEAACVHAVLASNALNKLYAAGVARVVATDTIERAVSELSVATLIAEKLRS